ncbi:MAG: hypothetical protein J7M25_08570 [Deltaproteobacteria bacterium]|nr:hypothetical protein [Deltaproteobacteria bacterium]
MRGIWVLLVVAVAWAGCRPVRVKAPDVTGAYLRALARRDDDRAYGLLAPSVRRRVSRSSFQRNVERMSPEELKGLHKLAGSSMSYRYRVDVALGASRTLSLMRTSGTWRITGSLFGFYPQKTPRQAVRSFVQALAHRRYRILMRFVPNRYRRMIRVSSLKKMYQGPSRGRVKILLKNLKENLDLPFQVTGDRAVMFYGDGHKIRLVREEGVWRIADFE